MTAPKVSKKKAFLLDPNHTHFALKCFIHAMEEEKEMPEIDPDIPLVKKAYHYTGSGQKLPIRQKDLVAMMDMKLKDILQHILKHQGASHEGQSLSDLHKKRD